MVATVGSVPRLTPINRSATPIGPPGSYSWPFPFRFWSTSDSTSETSLMVSPSKLEEDMLHPGSEQDHLRSSGQEPLTTFRRPLVGYRRSSRCMVCGLSQRQSYLSINSHAQSKHRGRRPLLRSYSVTSPKELSRFLDFVVEETGQMANHPHYEELRRVAKLDDIPWKSGAGEWMEKIVHFVIDAHVQPCTDDKCGLTYIQINGSTRWNAFTASNCDRCQSLDKAGTHMWVVDSTHSSGPFVGNLSAACISLNVAPDEGWIPLSRMPLPRGGRCKICNSFRPHRNPTFWGGPAFYLLALCMRVQFCLCKVQKEGQVSAFPWT